MTDNVHKILIPDTVKDRIDEDELRLRDLALRHAVPLIVASLEKGLVPDGGSYDPIIQSVYDYLKTGKMK